MTSPIAGSSRPIPDVAPAAMQDHASTNASNPTNGGTFRSALENAMNDKPAATPTRAPARARREQGITRQAGVRDSRDGARAAEGQSANAGATQGETASWDRAPSSPVDLQESVTPRDESALALTLGISDRAKDLPVPSIVVDPTLVLALGGDRPVGRIDAASTRPDAKASNADGDVSPMIDQQALAAQFVEAAIGDVAAALNAAPSATNSGAASAALAGATAAAAGTNLPNVSSAASAIVDTRAADTPAVVRRSTDALVPDLRLRLDRVIDRMKSEFGYSVEVVETVRSQARQDELFAQGRSAPGEVVTWTRNSKHTAGRAVDVVIDGSYENAAAYRDLAQVAREEGLRSLWPRDGGHLEIAGAATHTDLPLPASADGNAANGASTRTVPALPVQARAGIDVESWLDSVVSPANIKSRLDELTPSIPTLSRIPSSAAEVVLPHASGREQLRQSLGSGRDS
ncbi:MAG: M15 family metallopeptidase, partial [Gemmatimonadaceae bacterium]